jgi:phosphopantothenoylcysteine decarboxylase / phosphopantothenate---cysteine ligase
MSLLALGVTGGIGAYKAVEVARGLQKHGHEVAAIMTRSARKFVGELTFEAITRRRVITDQFSPGANSDIEHISLASDIALLVVAPATANIIGKFANGIADDFLTSLYLATRAPVLIAPAMNTNMLEHEAVRENLATLAARGVRFVDPGQGYLACGWIGKGRLAEPDDIVEAAHQMVLPRGTLLGRLVVVTAGPTFEDIDSVRYVGNRSSGKMGYAIGAEAARRGARVVLISGPTHLAAPSGTEVVAVRSAHEMRGAVQQHASDADIVVMAAAVADYTPEARAAGKIEKSDAPMELRLVRTPDILAELGSRRSGASPVLIGFAAESGDPVARAREKLFRKHADFIVANDISRTDAGFEVDANAVTIVSAEREDHIPLAPKAEIAAAILDRAEARLAALSPKSEAGLSREP